METTIENYKVIEYKKCNIYIIENILDETFCDKIIKLIEILPLKTIGLEKFNNVECYIAHTFELLKEDNSFYYEFDTNYNDINSSSLIYNKSPPKTNNKLNGISGEKLQEHIDEISEKMKVVIKIMKIVNSRICLDYNSGYNLRKIYGETKVHADSILDTYKPGDDVIFVNNNNIDNFTMVRNASIIFALNEDYDGGIFNFPDHNIKIKMKKGSVIIFPPYWTHLHEVSRVENNTFRYTINTWALEKIDIPR